MNKILFHYDAIELCRLLINLKAEKIFPRYKIEISTSKTNAESEQDLQHVNKSDDP